MTTERVPPHDLDSEMALIGSLLMHVDVLYEVQPIIGGPEVFYLPAHAEIYKRIVQLRDENKPVDLLTMCDVLREAGRLDAVGGQEYMIALAESCADWANAEHYAGIVLEHYQRRELIRAGTRLVSDAYALADPNESAAAHVVSVSDVTARTSEQQMEDATVTIAELRETFEAGGSPVGLIKTGFVKFDEEIGGIPLGGYTVLAASESVGKTSLALSWALQAKWAGMPTLFVSAEMPRNQIGMRLVSMMTGVSLRRIVEEPGAERRRRLFGEALKCLDGEGLHITDCTKDVRRVVELARAYVRFKGVKLIVVDYLQLLNMRGKFHSTNDRVTEMSHALKGLAQDTGAAVVVLSQFSREVKKAGREPQNADLRDSGTIEQDADLILLLWPKPLRGNEDEYPERDITMICSKNRNGPTGRYSLVFEKASMVFRSEAVLPVS